ncbi:hypothetical protein JDV02_005422 [Purpureocillium takamizusanense]|uniref:Uncharacterized protein n=1 Tax=Purpureocillium takamizusanense TaxID=2060973 RepID=A0A9Q8QG06_9HYPO|nr:uncharacterized protein JDV02_005422 [Purpureocillium takamizusanense]UNI19223.1 hypothetical protein JDV02_005422 [Purpureocillium takamizusanense]
MHRRRAYIKTPSPWFTASCSVGAKAISQHLPRLCREEERTKNHPRQQIVKTFLLSFLPVAVYAMPVLQDGDVLWQTITTSEADARAAAAAFNDDGIDGACITHWFQ